MRTCSERAVQYLGFQKAISEYFPPRLNTTEFESYSLFTKHVEVESNDCTFLIWVVAKSRELKHGKI